MGLFDKLFGGLGKTRQQIDLEELFQGYAPDSEDFYDNLEEMLILSDAGMETAERVSSPPCTTSALTKISSAATRPVRS